MGFLQLTRWFGHGIFVRIILIRILLRLIQLRLFGKSLFKHYVPRHFFASTSTGFILKKQKRGYTSSPLSNQPTKTNNYNPTYFQITRGVAVRIQSI